MGNSLKLLSAAVAAALLAGCAADGGLAQNIRQVQVPQQWRPNTDKAAVTDQWLKQISQDKALAQLVEKALSANHQLRQQAYNVDIKRQQVIASGAALWPGLDLSLTDSRKKVVSITDNKSLSLDLSYQVDLWGKLSDSERQANLNYLSEKAKYEQARQQLVGDVVTGWYGVIEAQQQLALYQARVANSRQNLEIIEMGYREGLNNALDVYLTRNQLNSELSRVTQQQDVLDKAKRQLERLVGEYPAAALSVKADLPLLEDEIPLGIPSELVARKPSLVSAWYRLLALDAGLAFAHKQRFPSLTLKAGLSKSGDSFSDVISGTTGWSLLGSLTAPLFDAGKLKANEEQARLTLRQSEQSYLDTLYSAFTDVENAISSEAALKARYKVMIEAQNNAVAAQKLSFEQYQSGLVSYTTVLEAQNRAYDAQSTVIQLKNQLVANRVKLHLALGGDFAEPAVEGVE